MVAQQVPPQGLETPKKTPGNVALSTPGGAIGGATGSIDGDLQAIIDVWAQLSEVTKSQIMAMVRAEESLSPPPDAHHCR